MHVCEWHMFILHVLVIVVIYAVLFSYDFKHWILDLGCRPSDQVCGVSHMAQRFSSPSPTPSLKFRIYYCLYPKKKKSNIGFEIFGNLKF